MNNISIMGNITKDLELRFTPKGTPVLKFSIAVNHRTKSESGEVKDKPSFFDIEAWGKTAEFITKDWTKGKQILLSGRLDQQSWEKEGVKHYKTVIVAERVFFTGKKDVAAPQEEAVDTGL